MQKIFDQITETINENKRIIITAHKGMDLDAIGSSLCLYKIAKALKKDSYVLTDDVKTNQTLQKSLEILKKHKEDINFIIGKDLKKLNSKDTLLIITDTNKKGLLSYPEILDMFDKVIVIDHHIKSGDVIKNTLLTYINNDCSSATEIMSEYLKHIKIEVSSAIATIMLAGIEIDTNGFNIKTTPNTFKTAARLLEMGANNIEKQQLLKENKENYCRRQDFIKKSYMINDNMALCMMDKNIYERYQLALISEDLLQFDKVEASFTIGFIGEGQIGISARSIGDIDVEKIMRKLGGGGHQTDAACLIESKKLEEVKEQLLGVIK